MTVAPSIVRNQSHPLAAEHRWRRQWRRLGSALANARHAPGWSLAATLLAILAAVPVISVVLIGMRESNGTWSHLASTVLPAALANTFWLILGTGLLTLVTGTGAAWLVTMYRFPGRALADRLLVLPLAMPVYIVAYAYAELLDYAGPVQTSLREALGATRPQDYFFPDIRSLPGAVVVFASVLYPYVYLAARASFVQQSICVLEVARTLGRSALSAFWSVALPMARPALAAGLALVLMEVLNDLGAVQYLGVETLSASVFATWTQRGDLTGAAQIASVMLVVIFALLIAERIARGEGTIEDTTGRYRAIPFETLEGWRGWLALSLAGFPSLIGFFLPFSVLANRAIAQLPEGLSADYFAAARNSLLLAGVTAAVTIVFAVFFGYAARVAKNAVTSGAARFASLGYALPGTVLAIGLFIPLAAFDNAIDGWMRQTFSFSTGLMLSGSLFAVTAALVIRFLAIAIGSIESGLERISPNLDAAGRALGASAFSIMLRVHLPMLVPALGAAALLVFVDAMKELPATLLLRPLGFDTLATHVYGLAAAERLEEATLGAVSIVLAGLLPVLLLHHTIAGGRTGARRGTGS